MSITNNFHDGNPPKPIISTINNLKFNKKYKLQRSYNNLIKNKEFTINEDKKNIRKMYIFRNY